MKVIDLSSAIKNSPRETPDYLKTQIAYHSHADGAKQAKMILNIPEQAFKENEGWATETIERLGTHDTTHVDAPWHYNSCIEGQKAQTIDELPLEWFFGNGVVLDMSAQEDGDVITVDDLEKALRKISYSLRCRDIVFIRTDCDQYYHLPHYIFRGPGVSPEATLWLYNKGIRVMGIDAWGWDAPLDKQARNYALNPKENIFWAAHQVGVSYAHIERLINLSMLPPLGFKVSCFPLKIEKGSAGPARVVAIFEDGIYQKK